MKTEPNDIQPEALNVPAQSESASKPDPLPASAKPAKPQLGRFRRFWRTSMIWLVVVAVAFLAGVLTFNYVRYKPLNEMLIQTQNELAQSSQNISNLEAKLAAASDKVTALENDNQALQSELDMANSHLELLQVLVGVTNARLALVDEDVPAAKVALENSAQQLDSFAPRIAEVDSNLAQSIPQRLALILSGLDSNIETAKVDLELLTGSLLDAEAALFGKQ
jgi:outer membrane murein-binding lipoprotein Lpp